MYSVPPFPCVRASVFAWILFCRAREYFGYNENFLNDAGICNELRELRFSKDFAFIDEFFSSEGGGGPGDENDQNKPEPEYEEVEVEDIDVEGVFIEELPLPEVQTLTLEENKYGKRFRDCRYV